jgi:PAS domain S-box-containing protein
MTGSAGEKRRDKLERTVHDLADFVDNGAVGLHWVAADGTILWANRSDYEFLGYSADEYIGQSITQFHADAGVIADIMARLASGMTIHDYEARLRCKDGSIRHVAISSSALFDDAGRFVHTRCFTRDITEHRRLENELADTRRTLQILSDTSRGLVEAGLDLDAIFLTLTRTVVDAVGDSCVVRLLSWDRAWLEIRATGHRDLCASNLLHDLRGEREPTTGGPSGEVIRTRQAMCVDGVSSGFDASSKSERIGAYLHRYPSRTTFVAPLVARGKVLGTVAMARTTSSPAYTETEVKLLEDVADRVSLAVSSALQYQQEIASANAARRSQEQLQLVTDGIPVLVAYVGADQRYRLVNSLHESWFGQPRERVLGRALPELLGEAAYETLRPRIQAALAGETVTFEAVVPYHAGSRFVRASYIPHRGPSGTIEGYVALVADISEEKRLVAEREELLQREKAAREHLAFLANASAVLTASLDYNVTLNSVADLMLPMLGDFGFFDVVEDDAQVRRIARAHNDPRRQALLDQTRWVRSERSDLNLCALSSGRAGIHPHIDDTWLKNVAASPAHLDLMQELAFGSMITVPLVHHAKIRGALTLFFADSGRRHTDADVQLADELARRAAAAVENASLFKDAQKAIAVRDDFLSVAGHELRTPLTALQLHLFSVVKMLADGSPHHAAADRAKKAAKSATRLSALIDELLDISRISAGRLTLEPTSFDLVAAVRDVLEQSADDVIRAGCTIDFRTDGEVVGEWDRERIQQVVTNLLLNAIKYGKGRSVVVTVARSGSGAQLGVRDFGIGISLDDQHRVFERFERAVSSRHFGGLGLGLWIVRQIVECHGGTIRVESAPEQGAFFEVCVPLVPPRALPK